MPVDMRGIGCDVLAATARKWLRSPRGIALLAVSREALARLAPAPFADSAHLEWRPDTGSFADAGMAERFESFDYSVSLRLGLGTAIDVANELGLSRIADAVLELAAYARERIAGARLRLHGPAEPQSGITSVLLPAARKDELERALHAARFAVKFPDFTNEPFAPAPPNMALLRISAHVYNSSEDIDALFDAVAECL
jgi:selenocysteine lyase/cysteine desulfurase